MKQGLYRLEKYMYLNVVSFLVKSLKIKTALKSPVFYYFLQDLKLLNGGTNQHKIVLP